ncbi:MAG: hypothetical protein KAW09_07905 [Thermoplasmata archaeon]|nr:hypothetical protein [Thermoplasmata archaeon]
MRYAPHTAANPRSQMIIRLDTRSGYIQVVPQFASQYLSGARMVVRKADSERGTSRIFRVEAEPSAANFEA